MHNYMPMIPQPRWQDVVDVLIVAYVIWHRAFDSRHAHDADGVDGDRGAFVASQVLGLFTLNWLLNNFLGICSCSWCILLPGGYPARADSVGAQSFLGRNSAVLAPAEEIATAAAWRSARRVGALIVIEQTTDGREFVETGRVVDGKVSPELLELILLRTALREHDGAVIINLAIELTAERACCPSRKPQRQPVARQADRAAIGMSEDSDALVLVVSEESGAISLARGGVLSAGSSRPRFCRR